MGREISHMEENNFMPYKVGQRVVRHITISELCDETEEILSKVYLIKEIDGSTLTCECEETGEIVTIYNTNHVRLVPSYGLDVLLNSYFNKNTVNIICGGYMEEVLQQLAKLNKTVLPFEFAAQKTKTKRNNVIVKTTTEKFLAQKFIFRADEVVVNNKQLIVLVDNPFMLDVFSLCAIKHKRKPIFWLSTKQGNVVRVDSPFAYQWYCDNVLAPLEELRLALCD